jgi:diacylglycerol kinase family enzyme
VQLFPVRPDVVVLLNSRAGRQDPAVEQALAAAFEAAGCDAAIQMTDGARIAADCSNALNDGARVIVAGGGDGTVSSVAAALVGRDAALGVVPLGTLNHFAKDLGLPVDVEGAARVIAARQTTCVDVGEVNGRSFINNSSIGLYARLVAERKKRERFGRSKWIDHGVAAVQVWSRYYRRLHVTLRGQGVDRRVRTPFVFIGNNEYQLSGVELGGRRRLNGGCLQICMAPGMTRGGVVRMIVAAVFGRIHTIHGFESFTTTEFTLDAGHRRIEVALDGEVLIMANPLEYRIRSGVLRVIVPAILPPEKS